MNVYACHGLNNAYTANFSIFAVTKHKNMRYIYSLFGLLLGFSMTAGAQQSPQAKVNSTASCSDLSVHSRLIDLNKELEAKKYNMVFFSSGNIPSKNLMSVRLECKAGETYEIRYVLGAHASKYQLNVIDNNVSHILKKKDKLNGAGLTVISEQFVARSTGVYVIVYSQQAKVDNCVGLSVFKK
ncbi:MAG: hypothetical protein BGO31_13925 [Bacteroidetes bacterium 43-16]|nr:MAG: hypothetical protein BGO31_13925 [Bacteroidetes bacterium 43-16]